MAQRRQRKRPYNTFTEENLEAALHHLCRGNISFREAECQYGVPKSTLCRKFNGQQGRHPGRQNVFSLLEERLFVDGVVTAAKWGFPLTNLDIRLIAKSYLDKRGLRISQFKDNTPGRKWAKAFLKRHRDKLSERLSQNIKRNRSAISKETINNFFDNLETTITGVPQDRILNYDETNFTDDPGSSKVIVRRGIKHAERILDTSKSSTSVMFTIAGDGSLLPIYVVYKAVHLHDTWCMHGPPHTVHNRSRSRWFDSCIFSDWFFKVALPYFKKLEGHEKKILIGDNLASHLTLSVIQSCQENNIEFVLLPPNSTHLLQPLDVACFGPLKRAWKKNLLEWNKRHRGVLPKDVFPSILKQTVMELEAIAETTIKSGFRTCGIIPINRNSVLQKLPDTEDEDDTQNVNEHVSSSFTDILKNSRLPENEPPRKRQKRINVPPGKGITAADILNGQNSANENKIHDGDEEDEERIIDNEEITEPETDEPEVDELEADELEANETECDNPFSENSCDERTDCDNYREPKEGSFVKCRFIYNKGTKKEIQKDFVSKVLQINRNDLFEVSYLRYDERTSSYVSQQ